MSHLPLLYVISPIGAEGSPVREKANRILKLVRQAAQFAFKVERADECKEGARIADAMLKKIATAPMAVAYLGEPPWNPNVMFEVGYRLALKKPLLIVSIDDESHTLPFDLRDFRQTKLHPSVLEKGFSIEDFEVVSEKVGKDILSSLGQSGWNSSYAVAEVMIDQTAGLSNEELLKNSVFLWSSPAADRLFQVTGTLAGMQITEALKHLEKYIEPDQWKEVVKEQDTLIGRLTQGKSDIKSTVPLVFRDDDVARDDLMLPADYRGCVYAGMIAQHIKIENALLLRMLYYKLHGPLQMRKLSKGKGAYYECDLDSAAICNSHTCPHLDELYADLISANSIKSVAR